VPIYRFTLECNHNDIDGSGADLAGMAIIVEVDADTWPAAVDIEQIVLAATRARCQVQHAEVLK
jgi:hypothetical protein